MSLVSSYPPAVGVHPCTRLGDVALRLEEKVVSHLCIFFDNPLQRHDVQRAHLWVSQLEIMPTFSSAVCSWFVDVPTPELARIHPHACASPPASHHGVGYKRVFSRCGPPLTPVGFLATFPRAFELACPEWTSWTRSSCAIGIPRTFATCDGLNEIACKYKPQGMFASESQSGSEETRTREHSKVRNESSVQSSKESFL